MNEERQKIVDRFNRNAKHQQDLIQGYWGGVGAYLPEHTEVPLTY